MRKLLILAFLIGSAWLCCSLPIHPQAKLSGTAELSGTATLSSVSAAVPLVVKNEASIDNGLASVVTNYNPFTVNAAGDLLVIGVTEGVSVNSSDATPVAFCDSTGSSACSGAYTGWSSTDAFTTGTTTVTSTSAYTSVTFAWTCKVTAGVQYFSVAFNSASVSVDETVTVYDVSHNVKAGCHDASGYVTAATIGSTIVSSSFSTAVANEIGIALFADNNNCGPDFSGSAISPYSMDTKASSCSSMLGAPAHTIYTATQSSVTGGFNTGNSSGDTNGALRVETWE